MSLDEQLNKTGFPLQQRVYQFLRDDLAQQVQSVDVTAELEVPYELPSGEITGIDVRGSIASTYNPRSNRASFVIECKKHYTTANLNSTDWLFMGYDEKDMQKLEATVIGRRVLSEAESRATFVVRTDSRFINNSYFHLPQLGVNAMDQLPYTYQGIEMHIKPNQIPKEERIYKALTQVAYGAIQTLYDHQYMKQMENNLDESNRIYVVPIVATTAKLHITSHEYKNTSLDTGELSDGNIKDVNWVAYQYPLSSSLKKNMVFDYLTIFIVESSFLPRFLQACWNRLSTY